MKLAQASNNRKKILIAPLNWGIGHATRCVPIINALQKEGFEPIIASDGNALKFLQEEFPNLKSYKLPSYNIQYAKNGKFLKYKLLFQIPRILNIIRQEKKRIAQIVEKEQISGIISDNRFGVRSTKISSIYITHQVRVLSGFTTFLTNCFHRKIIKKFDECWIPDSFNKTKLSGKLSTVKNSKLNLKYIGLLSQFKKSNSLLKENNTKQNILVLLSGPEPQRSLLEKKLIHEFSTSQKKVLFVRGILSDTSKLKNTNNINFVNFLYKNELEKAINQSEFVIARSGYSTIMDLAILQKKAFFIPTPGQTEQEYLAKHLKKLKIADFSKQKDFKIAHLKTVSNYNGFTDIENKNKFNFEIFL